MESKIDEDNVLSAMSAYDFSAPIQTVIFLEDNVDSDEEEQTTNESETIQSENKCTNEHKTDKIDTPQKTYNNESTLKDPSSNYTINLKSHNETIIGKGQGTSPNKSGSRKRPREDKNNQNCAKSCYFPADINAELNENLRKSNHYIKAALKIVSENLLHIVAAKAKLYSNPSAMTKENIDKNFIAIKHNFFKMTYSVTVTILLPLQNNSRFIQSIIFSTYQYGRFNGVHSSQEALMVLYWEMLNWTKEYRFNCIPPISANHQLFTPYEPSGVPQNGTTTYPMKDGIQQPVQGSVQPQYMPPRHGARIYLHNYTNVPHQLDVQKESQTANSSTVPTANTLHPLSNKITQNQAYVINQSVQKLNFQTNSPNQTINPSKLNGNTETPPPSYYAHINVNVANTCNADNYIQNIAITANKQPSKNVQDPHPEVRSLSRDSGFASPLPHGKEVMNESFTEVTPMITEVTSLNPVVRHLSVKPCTVCLKPTQKVCLGCYKEYFCSYECLESIWRVHRVYCRTNKNDCSKN